MKKKFLYAIVALIGMMGVFTSCSKDKEPEGDVLCNLTVSGTVVDEKGDAVQGVRVKLYRETSSGGWSLVSSATTNAAGDYSISKASIVVIIGKAKVAIDDAADYNTAEVEFHLSSVDYTGGDRQLFAGTANVSGVNLSVVKK